MADIINNKQKWNERLEAAKKFAHAIGEECKIKIFPDGSEHFEVHGWFHSERSNHRVADNHRADNHISPNNHSSSNK